MARSDWAALLTEPAAEYIALTELRRFGIEPYLPQLRRRHHVRPGHYVNRQYPLFPRYLFIRINDTTAPAIHMARGISRFRPILADDDGRPWRTQHRIIEAIRLAEANGNFDQIMHKGDCVTLAYGVLSTIRSTLAGDPALTAKVELLMPLFGGARAKVSTANIVQA
jgi:hypothetical protein